MAIILIKEISWISFTFLLALSTFKASGTSLSCLYPKCPSCIPYVDLTCASNGITYLNPCWVDCYNQMPDCEPIKVARKGWCPMTIRPSRRTSPPPTIVTLSTPVPTCNATACYCRSAYNPVCGSDGVTYSNTCFLRCARRCFLDLEFVKCGLCSWSYPPDRLCLGKAVI